MEFLIADTFTDSLARLTGEEQKAVKTAAFDLQLNPAHPSLQMHKLDKAKDPNFWSARVNRDVRRLAQALLQHLRHQGRPRTAADQHHLVDLGAEGPASGLSTLLRRALERVEAISPAGLAQPRTALN